MDPIALGIPEYADIIKQPMDFSTIEQKLDDGYDTFSEFVSDVRLVFSNAMTFNPPGHAVHKMANNLSKLFTKQIDALERSMQQERERSQKPKQKKAIAGPKRQPRTPSTPAPKPEPSNKRRKVAQPTWQAPPPAPSPAPAPAVPSHGPGMVVVPVSEISELRDQMRMLTAQVAMYQNEVGRLKAGESRAAPSASSETAKNYIPLTDAEKRELSEDVEKLNEEQLQEVVNIVSERMPLGGAGADDEIEIDLDVLDIPTLRALQRYVKDVLEPPKKKGKRKYTPRQPRQKKTKQGSAKDAQDHPMDSAADDGSWKDDLRLGDPLPYPGKCVGTSFSLPSHVAFQRQVLPHSSV